MNTCRGCGAGLKKTFVDLGASPLSNSYIKKHQLDEAETYYPLHPRVCEVCFLVQLPPIESPARIFSDYAYFSSYSDSWLDHARTYVDSIVSSLPSKAFVAEIASNDGYLLQYFQKYDVRVLGVEPARNVAAVAQQRGIPTETVFFGTASAGALKASHGQCDLIIANNVLAHVPDLHDFVAGFATLLGAEGRISFEFPHLLRLMEFLQFDTIYHEHFSYLSLLSLEPVFAKHGLRFIDVQELPSHGGSLRLWVAHEDSAWKRAGNVDRILDAEKAAQLDQIDTYSAFGERVVRIKNATLRFLLDAARDGMKIAAYGAPAKGNTFLNFAGIRSDLIPYTVDRNPVKQGTYLPGSRIPVCEPNRIFEERPDYVFVLPWNLLDEITTQLAGIREWGGKFVVAIPSLRTI